MFCLVIAVKLVSASYTIIPLTTAITAAQTKKIADGYWTNVDSRDRDYNRMAVYRENPELRLHILKYFWDKTPESSRYPIFSERFGNHLIIKQGEADVFEFFFNPQRNFDMNHYSYQASNRESIDLSSFYDGSECSYSTSYMTPLMVAVLLNKPESVKLLVNASLTPKLKLDKAMYADELITARVIARKIKNQSVRNVMLSKLKIDPNKHDMSIINYVLKEDLDINVKEAVIANSLSMIEAALLLGNFGDKNDVTIIKYAIENGNYLIIEALVMEGYAIPATKPKYPANLNKEDTDFILTDRAERVPLPKRAPWGLISYNAHCF